MDLTWCFPQPEPVSVGARTLLALPLRLVDLARLQGYCKTVRPCPLDAVRSQIAVASEGSEARRRLLRDTYRACQNWPARLGSEDGRQILATGEGLLFWLATVLGPVNPELSPEDMEELAGSITVAQYERLMRIAYAVAPLDELSRLITPDSFPRDDQVTNWGKLIRSLVIETGWTFTECGELRLSQLAAFQSNGGYGTGKVDPPPGMTRWDFSRRQKRFFGPDRGENEEAI